MDEHSLYWKKEDLMWKDTEVLAYSREDGFGRPPRSVTGFQTGTAVVLGLVALGGFLFNPGVCPELRGWADGILVAMFLLLVFSIPMLARGSSIAPWTLAASAICGVVVSAFVVPQTSASGTITLAAFSLLSLAAVIMMIGQIRILVFYAKAKKRMRIEDAAVEPPRIPERLQVEQPPQASASSQIVQDDSALFESSDDHPL